MREEGLVTAKLCRLAIWHRSTLTGSQGQGCPSPRSMMAPWYPGLGLGAQIELEQIVRSVDVLRSERVVPRFRGGGPET